VGVANKYPAFRATSEMRVTRNIEIINKNAFGLDESNPPDNSSFNLVRFREEDENKGGSADKRLKRLQNQDINESWFDQQ